MDLIRDVGRAIQSLEVAIERCRSTGDEVEAIGLRLSILLAGSERPKDE
tara:strand:- start:747 stop:893 length:147 start_codon:yes stop_codon:yes gene_type:complete